MIVFVYNGVVLILKSIVKKKIKTIKKTKQDRNVFVCMCILTEINDHLQ